ncbi:hypothetical protein PBRA_009721 [Plasmodiophora brassicae]|uniref:Uncharacterized protein n=1 Tax=Plasmodiophora brassicae TaxID=37360 RepID=A0A0G4IM75_PLABS|nr:hypothetical protein PBRA_009721 [Plasmodiophora brassicae]
MPCLPVLLASPPTSPPTRSARAKASPTKATHPAAAQYLWIYYIQNRRLHPYGGRCQRCGHLLHTWGYRMSRIPDDTSTPTSPPTISARYLWMKYIQNRRRQP